ncbi:hypothetical protein R1flu_000945 [Riccia fluitans]|uniref:Ribosomal protein S13 n=1 Tax=Riccia fluitans TaxID=41844 RepID=A0ABD1Y1X7_9MARC
MPKDKRVAVRRIDVVDMQKRQLIRVRQIGELTVRTKNGSRKNRPPRVADRRVDKAGRGNGHNHESELRERAWGLTWNPGQRS